MSTKPDTEAASARPNTASPRRRAVTFAAEELRLISALVVLMAVGLFLALPFVLSIGSVVFLPITTAIILMIVLSPLVVLAALVLAVACLARRVNPFAALSRAYRVCAALRGLRVEVHEGRSTVLVSVV